MAAARYLCAGGGNLAHPSDLLAALFRYDPSVRYGLAVQAYRTGGAPVIPAQDGAVPEPPPAPVPPPAAVLAAPEGSGPPEVAPATPDGLAEPAPRQDPVPGTGPPLDGPAGPGPDAPADPATSEPPASDPPEQGTAEGSADDTTAVSPTPTPTPAPTRTPTPTPGPDCDSLVLSASHAVVLPDSGGLLLRFPTDDLPDGCTITSATLRLDPGAAAAERTVQVERVADEWSDQTTRTPTTVGGTVTADAATGERVWSVDALLAVLVDGPDRGLLLSTAGDGDPVSLIEDGSARLEIVLGPAQPA